MIKKPRTYYIQNDHHKKLQKLVKEKTKSSGIQPSLSSVVSFIFDKFFKSTDIKK